MIGEKAIVVALAGPFIFCAFLISRKLIEMLFTNEPYWLGREGYVDKAKQPFTHAFYVFVFAFGLLVSLGFVGLCLWTALHV